MPITNEGLGLPSSFRQTRQNAPGNWFSGALIGNQFGLVRGAIRDRKLKAGSLLDATTLLQGNSKYRIAGLGIACPRQVRSQFRVSNSRVCWGGCSKGIGICIPGGFGNHRVANPATGVVSATRPLNKVLCHPNPPVSGLAGAIHAIPGAS